MITVSVKTEKGWHVVAECWNEATAYSYIKNTYGADKMELVHILDDVYRVYDRRHSEPVLVRIGGISKVESVAQSSGGWSTPRVVSIEQVTEEELNREMAEFNKTHGTWFKSFIKWLKEFI